MNIRTTGGTGPFSAETLTIDHAAETDRIVSGLRGQLRSMKKRGLVLGLSGGIDSTAIAALAIASRPVDSQTCHGNAIRRQSGLSMRMT